VYTLVHLRDRPVCGWRCRGRPKKKKERRNVVKKHLKPSFVALCVLLVACGFTVRQCGFTRFDFVRVSENGFDPVDNAQDFNDYPWAMEYFVPDGADEGYLYVGTVNNVINGVMYWIGVTDVPPEPKPPEIRRYRPDLGVRGNERAWETVLDMRDQTVGAGGLRYMKSYRAQYDSVNYLYAATVSYPPAVWRTATGDPGDWDVIWTASAGASIRWMEIHNGLLYVATTFDLGVIDAPFQIWATDGDSFWSVVENGLGSPDNDSVYCLASYNGWLYAGTENPTTGYEVWKLEGPGEDGATPVQVVANGGPTPRNEIAGTMFVFRDKLYVGSMVPFGYNPWTGNVFKGCDVIRIDENDNWETIVGSNSVSGYDSGFGQFSNGYLWMMEEHDGWLYAGTFDNAVVIAMLVEQNPEILVDMIKYLVTGESPFDGLLPKQPSWADLLFDAGADLYKTRDGDTWEPVFTDGLGDPNNYGVRTMKSVGDCLYLGMSNPFDGLEVWRACSSAN